MAYTIGLDFGTNSVRCLIVDVSNGEELGNSIYAYESGEQGVILDAADHLLARQNPADYLKGIEVSIQGALSEAGQTNKAFDAGRIIGIGVDTTGSTPLPVDQNGRALSDHAAFKDNPNAYAWLWKDHTAHAEAAEITDLARREHPEYLAKCGGTYSSEWFFSKILHCLRTDPAVFDAAYAWMECADYVPAALSGSLPNGQFKASRCAAGHKAMFNDAWGGLPSRDFLAKLHPKLAELRDRLYHTTYTAGIPVGELTPAWAQRLGLTPGIPVAVGAFDAHLGAIGAGVAPGKLVKIIGTSTCDIIVWPNTENLPDIPGLCGIVDGSVLPGYFGLEAGQSAVGDIFNWFVNYIQPGGPESGSHVALTAKALRLKPGQSGLLALDWNNGNRTILVDQRLTGLIVGQTLHTKPEEIYRALIEATAFGALTIINRFEEYGVKIAEVINCGGIAEKNPFIMQIYADVIGREMLISRSSQTCSLGAAIAAAVAAGKANGGYESFADAQSAMCGVKDISYKPIPENHHVYRQLYPLYLQLHDAFGLKTRSGTLANVMKELLQIKESQTPHTP
jgi:L-ribulokinase